MKTAGSGNLDCNVTWEPSLLPNHLTEARSFEKSYYPTVLEENATTEGYRLATKSPGLPLTAMFGASVRPLSFPPPPRSWLHTDNVQDYDSLKLHSHATCTPSWRGVFFCQELGMPLLRERAARGSDRFITHKMHVKLARWWHAGASNGRRRCDV
jgi:hypothetical protein